MSDLESLQASSERVSERVSEPIIERKHFYILAALYAISVLSIFLTYKVMSNLPFWEEVMVAFFLGLPLASLALFTLLLFREMYLVMVIFLRLIKKLTEENN
ncbi:Transmembrane domain-containing protein [Brazilian cedratvirus IHUMI]|uniref:Transmembrane domain-containing protein n=1 Tax=Brazilian cedratvirus IHUMI TaxID=2126980 RepID=A0A2R8FDH6_9VIRU|nr:Transmembrane domain-containing protein [Brazilian cedratvirus IHUMI]